MTMPLFNLCGIRSFTKSFFNFISCFDCISTSFTCNLMRFSVQYILPFWIKARKQWTDTCNYHSCLAVTEGFDILASNQTYAIWPTVVWCYSLRSWSVTRCHKKIKLDSFQSDFICYYYDWLFILSSYAINLD